MLKKTEENIREFWRKHKVPITVAGICGVILMAKNHSLHKENDELQEKNDELENLNQTYAFENFAYRLGTSNRTLSKLMEAERERAGTDKPIFDQYFGKAS